MCIIYPVDHKGSMQSSYRDPEHNNVLDKSVWSHLSVLDD